MEYTLSLDDYTVNTPSFVEEYNKVSDEKKALMNLNRFLEALENKDYKYAYSKLYSTFRNNNFATQSDFENYMTQSWLEYENIETATAENQGGVHVCRLKILSANNEYIERTFMIQLTSGTDYLVSFEI